ncbi:DUF2752 domain-containing protein [Nocardioides abyssi]|uniref:DUF2752 domain-containing protein n=1 Tax=Nocardioides abyssi TaxID=3058370 RepID=A0ABT8EY86_9ACTN|nr:DUF2752 domain-containing protein [Nocardioides abyssi]MDN4163150.1 DUF2752 domain-containing protein [Nocardioides abyssi]
MTLRQRLLAPGVTLGGLAAAALALRLRDPHEPGAWGVCPSAALGLACPGCGGLRAVNDLTHGRWADAASSNLLLVALLLVLAVVGGWWVLRRRPDGRSPVSPRLARGATVTLGVVALAFTVLRNLPAGAWLAP